MVIRNYVLKLIDMNGEEVADIDISIDTNAGELCLSNDLDLHTIRLTLIEAIAHHELDNLQGGS